MCTQKKQAGSTRMPPCARGAEGAAVTEGMTAGAATSPATTKGVAGRGCSGADAIALSSNDDSNVAESKLCRFGSKLMNDKSSTCQSEC